MAINFNNQNGIGTLDLSQFGLMQPQNTNMQTAGFLPQFLGGTSNEEDAAQNSLQQIQDLRQQENAINSMGEGAQYLKQDELKNIQNQIQTIKNQNKNSQEFNAIGGQPGLAIKHCWNETNYTGGLVAVEGKTLTAGWGYFNSTTIIGVEDTPIGPTTLIKSNMVTDRCDLSHLSDLSMDANSALSHSRARIFSGTALGLVNSITGAHNATGLTSPFYPMPLPKGFAAGYNVVNTNNAQSILKFVGSTNRATTPILAPGIGGLAKVQSLTINGGDILQSSSFVVPADKYLVFTLVAGLISGAAPTVRLSGSRSIGGALTVRDKEMRAITGIMKSGMASLPGVRLYIKGGTFSSIIHIGGWHVTAFDSANEAVSFANAAIWPLSESETYTLINMTEKRRLDTNAGTGPVSPSYVQSELQETRDALATTQDVLATLIEDIRNGCILS